MQTSIRILVVGISMLLLTGGSFCLAQAQQNSVPDRARPRPADFQQPVLIEFKGEINSSLTGFFNRSMDKAKSSGADLIIIEVDSPGGLKQQSLQMARRLRDCEAYTVVIIQNKALSGGSLISLGVDEIHIDPDAKFGDSGEIVFDYERFMWRLIEPKVESDLSRDARDLAESKGRNPDLAESMIDSDHLVCMRTKPDGSLEFKAGSSDEVALFDPSWELIPETKLERFLTVSGQRAVQLGLAQGHGASRQAIAKELGIDMDDVKILQYGFVDSTVDFLNHPLVTGLLILIGLVALYLEMTAPGISIGGLVALLCGLLFFWSHFLGGTAGWLEVTLFVAGLAFVAAEIFVIPGFGIPGIMGMGLLFVSVVLASQDFIIPATAQQANRMATSVLITLLSSFGFLILAVIIAKNMKRLPIFNGIILKAGDPTEDGDAQQKLKPTPTHAGIAVGDWGIADSLLRPAGLVKINGRTVDVISDGSFVDPGTSVRVIKICGNVITVAEAEQDIDA